MRGGFGFRGFRPYRMGRRPFGFFPFIFFRGFFLVAALLIITLLLW